MTNRIIQLTIVTLAVILLLPSVSFAQQKKPKKKPRQYKRVHQNALALITSGKAEQAIEVLEQFAAKYPDDAETSYMLTVALAQTGDAEGAVKTMQWAVKLGLPRGRFAAGPRDLLAPIYKTDAYKKMIADYRRDLVHGPMLGDVRPDGISFWLRTAAPSHVDVYVYRLQGEELVLVARESAKSTDTSDLVAKIKVSGLKPNTLYEYDVDVRPDDTSGKKLPAYKKRDPANPGFCDIYLRFHTAPAVGHKKKFSLAFGGGSGYVPHNERAWMTILKQQPDLLLLLGDNTYSDAPKSSHMQKYCYYRRQSRPEYRLLTAMTPVYSIWDDHDFGTNDCIGGPEIDSPPWKQPVWNVFRENWINPGYGGGRKQPGVWHGFV